MTVPYVPRMLYDFSGTITTGGTPQLVLPVWGSRSYFLFQNTSSASLVLEIGSARGKAVVSGGAVTSISITNAGFNYTYAPSVLLIGGGHANGIIDGLGSPLQPQPTTPALASTTISGGSITSIPVLSGGAGYGTGGAVPYVYLINDPRDPFGGAVPSATTGFILPQNASLVMETNYITTDQISVYGGTTGQTFVCKAAL